MVFFMIGSWPSSDSASLDCWGVSMSLGFNLDLRVLSQSGASFEFGFEFEFVTE